MIRTYRFALDPTPRQARSLARHAGAARVAFNWDLAAVKANLDQREAERSYGIDGQRLTPLLGWSLPTLRKAWNRAEDEEAPWWRKCSKEAFNTGLERLARALKNWSASREGRRAGRRMGFPRFKTKRACVPSVRFTTGAIRVEPDRRHVTLPRLGLIKTHESTGKLERKLSVGTARILCATVRFDRGRWFVAFTVETARAVKSPRRPDTVIGVDLGVRHLAVLSDGTMVENPRRDDASRRKLARASRTVSRRQGPDRRRRQQPSNRWLRANTARNKVHYRVANQRRDGIHKLTTMLAREYGTVIVENLNVAGMVRNRRLARQIHDAGFGEIRRQLTYKRPRHVRQVAVKRQSRTRQHAWPGSDGNPYPLVDTSLRFAESERSGTMIEVKDLVKKYGATTAVDHLSFTVAPGRITGFLGPNGAGKSTTMRLILGLDRPSGGTALIDGKLYHDLRDPLRHVGALLEAKAVHGGRTAFNHLLYLAQTQGVPKRRVSEVLDLVGLGAVARKRTKGFSLGMGQRLGIAAALLADPKILILDEPVNGLDPEGVVWIRELLKALAADGRTIFVSSHLMNEMAVTADHLIVIGRGQLQADMPVAQFIAQFSDSAVLVRTPQTAEFQAAAAERGWSVTATAEDGMLIVTNSTAPQIGELAAERGLVLHELTPQRASLEEAYMELTRESGEFAHHPSPPPPPSPAPSSADALASGGHDGR